MTKVEPVGIQRLAALHYYVHDLERSRRFYTEQLNFAEVAVSGPELEQRGRQRSVMFEAGAAAIICSSPIGDGGRAHRYLQKHPDGIGSIVFEVEDAEKVFGLIEARGATPIDEIATFESGAGTLRTFSVTTPFGGTTFRFLERRGYRELIPGMRYHETPKGGCNAYGIEHIDHITSNFETMSPALLWLEHVMGFQHFWQVQFHTHDLFPRKDSGSGLKSRVMWEPRSNVKFANNEPLRPFFRRSQINAFYEEQRGDGVQHAALAVTDMVSVVRKLKEQGVQFMHTPDAYYDMLPERLLRSDIGSIDENLEDLRALGILVDGRAKGEYLLQIFLRDSASTHGDREAGPFFFELVERKGDRGFGEGNFRALFESIEREQAAAGQLVHAEQRDDSGEVPGAGVDGEPR